ncbi:hypothetical protein GN958_ATG10627 [Phytophthora infestans]|uniref:HAT C-terminal dimerisation domain-containing protein n=1 Tax=Phytophthora infestans TaxID=4787 RepID=A0A8S9UMD9_PHYIN|nr:hypothetical protein GN958_ATG10627 [Phytophthora infestans]
MTCIIRASFRNDSGLPVASTKANQGRLHGTTVGSSEWYRRRVKAICEHINVIRWFRESGRFIFPSVAALARIWLGKCPSNALQERVFSTGGFVMSSLRTRTDNKRAEIQVPLKHNRKVRRMQDEIYSAGN